MDFNWQLPNDWCHSGVPQGNGLWGSMIWGDCKTLKITFNRADYWFYGKNLPPDQEQSYANLKKFLKNGEEAELLRIFGGIAGNKRPLKSTRLPVGRILVDIPAVADNGKMKLNTQSSLATATIDNLIIKSIVPRNLPVLAVSVSGEKFQDCRFRSCPPEAEVVKTFFKDNCFPECEILDAVDGMTGGWLQAGSNAKHLCVMWHRTFNAESAEFFMVTMLGDTLEEARTSAEELLKKVTKCGFDKIYAETVSWWENYWKETPVINIPDKEISEIYYMGMYRMAGLYAPDVPPATLQGAWLEDYRMAPWSNDYHFNINVQECYWPTFAGNHPEYILSLFEMIKSWKETLREYARNFVGIEDGQMLPHAVDDKGIGLGGFWPGHVDHSCTAWTAQLMWQYWRYTLDEKFMRDTLYPFMKETMNVYAEMLEKDDQGNLFIAAESSPEYFENTIKAWGKNPTIHLASIHFLLDCLLELSEKIGSDSEKRQQWKEISSLLPRAAMTDDKEICIWEGQVLDQPHRHFSHLIGIYPYDLFDWRNNADDAEIINKTIGKWISEGNGFWAGWSFPWASMIYSRLENPESAHTMLSAYRRGFMKDDFAYRYLPGKPLFTTITGPAGSSIMQIEAGMASAAAVMEMCVYTSRGVIYPIAGIPCYWKEMSFSNILTDGAMLVSGECESGALLKLVVKSLKGGKAKIALPEGRFEIRGEKITGGKVYEAVLSENEELIISTDLQ